MIEAELADGTILEFPEGTSTDVIQAAVKKMTAGTAQQPSKDTEKPSMVQELARQFGLFGRSVVNAASAPVNAVADFASGAYNLGAEAIGSKSRLPYMSQMQQQALTQLGVPEPKNKLERAVMAANEAMAGVGGQAKAASKYAPKALEALTKDLAVQVPTAAASAATGQVVADKVMETTDNPLLATVAAMALGTAAGQATGRSVQGAMSPSQPKVTLADIKQRAQRSYAQMDDLGVQLKPLSVHNMLSDAEQQLQKANFNPQMDAHRPVQQLVDQLRDMTGTQRVPFTKLEQMRSAATDLSNSKDAATRKYARIVVNSIDNYMGDIKGSDVMINKQNASAAVEAVKSARKDWRNLSRADALESVLDTAELRATRPGASESELIRQGLINIAANKDKMRLFSAKEQAAIKSVIKGNAADPLLTLAAKFNPERNMLMQAGTMAGVATKPEVVIPIAAGGYGADKLQSFLRGRATKNLVGQIATDTVKEPLPNYRWRSLFESIPKD